MATILGTIQSTFTDFRYVRSVWERNAEEERLLGVSLTGIYDNRSLCDVDISGVLQELRAYCVEVNTEFAERLGINQSAAVSCIKPSGTVSQLVNSASGIHPRHSQYYIRSFRQDNKDPLTQFMKDSGIPHEPCVMKPETTTIFFFPVAAPEGAVTREQVDPISHLNLWKTYDQNWAEHQVSITVSVDEQAWPRVGAWVFDNFDDLSGVSFLPMDGGSYRQAPFQSCTKEKYEELLAKMPEMDWTKLSAYELEDTTTGSQEYACVGGACEVQW